MAKISRSEPPARTARTRFVLLAAFLSFAAPVARGADPLGRLFTTPRQRAQIDEVRNAAPKEEEVKLSGNELIRNQKQEKQSEEIKDPIVLKGVVSRADGLSTAWVNDGNTYMGDPALEYIQITPSRANVGDVTIRIPTRDTAVDLKVGETYEPASDRIINPVSAGAIEP
jgi:hypothetical protein